MNTPTLEHPANADQMLDNAKHRLQGANRLSSDEIIDLYNAAKSLQSTDTAGANKIFSFIKGVQPLEENKIMESTLKKVVKRIVKEIVSEMGKKNLAEMTTTGAVAGYNIPAAFSRRGGSKKGVDISKKLGFEETPEGKSEMDRDADRLM